MELQVTVGAAGSPTRWMAGLSGRRRGTWPWLGRAS